MADDSSSAAPDKSGSAGTAAAARGPAFVALKSGLVIRQYVIEEVIGAGGFGITYRAHHERLTSKLFALKEYFPRQFATRSGTHVVSTPDGEGLFGWGLDRFLKEAEALSKCEHPGIVDVVDYFEANGTAYAVLGYVEGQQMGHWLDRLGRPPTQAELDRVLMPLLDALDVVHRAKLLHRDIAPDNILIRRDGSPCLIDFGACREDIRERSQKVSAIVKHGYSPPEQYHGIAELQGPWTDIYAVGATIYRAISGQPPMDSSRRGALGDGLRPVGEMTEAPYRPGFMAAIDMALRLKPEERPRSIADWRAMLASEAAPVHEEPGRPEEPVGRKDTRQPTGGREDGRRAAASDGGNRRADAGPAKPAVETHGAGRRGAAIVAGIAAVALAGMGAVALWRSPEPAPRSEPGPKAGLVAKADPPAETKSGPIVPLTPDPEAAAERAWASLAGSADIAGLERFLELYGTSRRAAEARTRLAALRDEARRSEEALALAAQAKAAAERAAQAATDAWARVRQTTDVAAIERFIAEHGASPLAAEARARLAALRSEAERQGARDAAWAACNAAPDAVKVSACSRVVDGDDTPERRAAAYQLRGNAERKAASYDKAIADLTRSLELKSAQAQVLTDRGVAHFLKGGTAGREAALRDYDAALRIEPRHAEALNNRAWAVFQAGRAADALVDATKSIEASPTNGYAYDTRGQILEALGRRDDAIRDYERAVQIDPGQDTSRAGLARLRATRR